MPDPSLSNKLTEMNPGDTLKTNSVLYVEQISAFKHNFVDITAKIGLKGKIWIDQNSEFITFVEYTNIKIVDENTHLKKIQKRNSE